MLADAGCGVVETMAFPDHHPYTERDAEELLKLAAKVGATGFVTTEKDTVKISAGMLARLETVGPVVVVGLDVEFAEPDEVMRALEARIS